MPSAALPERRGTSVNHVRLRSPVRADAQAVLTLLVERDIADVGAPDITLDGLHDDWCRSDFDLAADARVVEAADGRIVGYAAMSREVTMLVVVAPDHEGRGIGSRLRRWAEGRDRAGGSACHSQWIAAGNQRARALLLTAGYRPARSYWRLARPLDDIHEGGTPPDGVTLRPVDVDQDAPALHTLNEVSFEASADYRPYSFTAFWDEHLRPHDFDSGLSHVAESDGRAVGFLLARRWREKNAGFIDLLGVHPEHRTRGLATAMLQTTSARATAAGLRQVELGVASDNPNALRLYESRGMTKQFRYDTYERAADPSANEPADTAGEPRPASPYPKIRTATEEEAAHLEALQRRSSDIWEQYREQLAAHPDAIELPSAFIHNGWVRVAVSAGGAPVGFSVVIPTGDQVHELDGLFVEPDHLRRGIGRALIADAVQRASARGGRYLEVIAGPAQGFYERTGFAVIGQAQTRFGPAVRMRRDLRRDCSPSDSYPAALTTSSAPNDPCSH